MIITPRRDLADARGMLEDALEAIKINGEPEMTVLALTFPQGGDEPRTILSVLWDASKIGPVSQNKLAKHMQDMACHAELCRELQNRISAGKDG